MVKSKVLFLHGLNTFGDDALHIGPLAFGPMDQYVKAAMLARGLEYRAVEGLGQGSPEAQVDRVIAAIQSWRTAAGAERIELHLLGNSNGGLTARAAAQVIADRDQRQIKMLSLITWGTPHRGALPAERTMTWHDRAKWLTPLAQAAGYDLTTRLETFRHYTPTALADFNRRHPPIADLPLYSLVCAVPAHKVSPCFWPLYPSLHGLSPLEFAAQLLHRDSTHAPSDGWISIGSQNWGERYGPFALDHLGQLGWTAFLGSKQLRNEADREFDRLCDTIATLVASLQG